MRFYSYGTVLKKCIIFFLETQHFPTFYKLNTRLVWYSYNHCTAIKIQETGAPTNDKQTHHFILMINTDSIFQKSFDDFHMTLCCCPLQSSVTSLQIKQNIKLIKITQKQCDLNKKHVCYFNHVHSDPPFVQLIIIQNVLSLKFVYFIVKIVMVD